MNKLKDLPEVTINMVCLGNICRSPIAAAILYNRTKDWSNPKIITTSSGTGAWHVGNGPHPNSKKVWEANGLNYEHTARQFSKNDFYSSDLILVMDSSNYQNVISLAPSPEEEAKVFYLRSFDPTSDPNDLDVPDPYSLPERAFEQVYEMIDRAVVGLLNEIKS